jgi:hypothetical protein
VSGGWAETFSAQYATNQTSDAKQNDNDHGKRNTVDLRASFRNFQFTHESPGGYKDKAIIAAFCESRLPSAAIVGHCIRVPVIRFMSNELRS